MVEVCVLDVCTTKRKEEKITRRKVRKEDWK